MGHHWSWSQQEMMGWQDPKITVTMTCCELCTPQNIVDTGPPTAGASSGACKPIHDHPKVVLLTY